MSKKDGFDTFENPINAAEGAAGDAVSGAADEIARLRLKLSRLQNHFDQAQQQTNKLVTDNQKKREIIDQLAHQVHTEKAEALQRAIEHQRQSSNKNDEAYKTHVSPNIVMTLIEGMDKANEALGASDTVDWAWGLEFWLPDHQEVLGEKRILEQRPISHELWVLAERMWACDLHCKYVITADDRRIILMIGATHEVLVKEAHECQVPMRVENTRGAMGFHEDLTKYYARFHGGLNEWDHEAAKWRLRAGQSRQKALILKDVDGDGDIDQADVELARAAAQDEEALRMGVLAEKEPDSLDAEELREELIYRGYKRDAEHPDIELQRHKVKDLRRRDARLLDSEDEHRIFTSALRQRLVKRRISKMCGIDLDVRLKAPGPKASLQWIEDHAVKRQTRIRSKKVHELLTACGGYRPEAGNVFVHEAGEESVVWKLAQQCLADPEFVMAPDRDEMAATPPSSKLLRVGLEPVTYEELKEVYFVLNRWIDPHTGPGRNEEFVGTFKAYFPLHDKRELAYLGDQWGSFKVLAMGTISGYREDGTLPVSFAHPENIPHEHTIPWSWSWQPINEIRDYFGEDCGLYYAWLGHYTSMLFLCMTFGCGVMAVQPYFGGVDKNPFTLAYSVYVGMWSVSFLEGWKRKEFEFRFLWGSDELDDEEDLRSEFVGKLIVTETGRERVVYSSAWKRYVLLFVSALICSICISFTVGAALAASQVRYFERPGTTDFCVEYPEQCCGEKTRPFLVDNLGYGNFANKAPHQCCEDVYFDTEHPLYNANATCCDGTRGDQPNSVCHLNAHGVPLELQRETDGLDNMECDPEKELEGSFLDNAEDHPCGMWKQKRWQFLSSALNLMIIQIFGFIYEDITDRLNFFENHRTHAEAHNSLVVKNFVFQFLNNYFMLFYIAFLRDWFAQKQGIQRIVAESTLPELQEQMLIVFTGKTIGKQVGHSAKPFALKWYNKAVSYVNNKRFQRAEQKRKEADPDYDMVDIEKEAALAIVATTPYEKQALLMP
jgi:hypothetical protein